MYSRKWDRFIDLFTNIGAFVPSALTTYFLCRFLTLPDIAIAAILVAVLIAHLVLMREKPSVTLPKLEPGSLNEVNRWGLIFVLLLILIVLVAPSLNIAWELAGSAYPVGFLFYDETYNVMIAHGLARDFPPLDLSYQGRTVHYHLGGPLLMEMVSRFSGLPLHTAFYGVVQIGMSLIVITSLLRLFRIAIPRASLFQRLWMLLIVNGVFLINPYNVIWNLRNILKTDVFDLNLIFSEMPIVSILPGPATMPTFYGEYLALALILVFLANIDRAHPIWIASALFATFLAKITVFAPIGFGWACWSVIALLRNRDLGPTIAGAIALALCIIALPFMNDNGVSHLILGVGPTLAKLSQEGTIILKALDMPTFSGVFLLGVAMIALSSHMFGFSTIRLARVKVRERYIDNSMSLVQILIWTMIAGILVTSILVFAVDPAVQVRFVETHQDIADKLWRPMNTYLEDHWQISIGYALLSTSLAFGLVSTILLCDYCLETGFRWWRLSCIVVCTSVVISMYQGITSNYDPFDHGFKKVDTDAAAALSSIPVVGTLVLSNDCRYDDVVAPYMPSMNAWAPSLWGHQFWACNFMFGNTFMAENAIHRLDQRRWFWSAGLPVGKHHREFLLREGITHAIVSFDAPDGKEMWESLVASGWPRVLYLGPRYGVLEIPLESGKDQPL